MLQSQDEKPLVAIITPVFNGARFLAETMACVQAQTYPNLVHIVLDNASSDGTPKVIKEYQGLRVRVIARRNQHALPLHQNWEAAVRMTPPDAEYFRLLCADDLMTADAIQRMVAIAEADVGVGLVGCLHQCGAQINAAGLPADRQVFDGRWVAKSYLMRLHFGVSPSHLLVRRRFLDEEVPFYTDGADATDLEVCLRILPRCKYGFVHEAIGWTRLHAGSVTSMTAAPNLSFMADWLDCIDRFGPPIMTVDELRKCRRAHLRHYFRRLLMLRFKGRNQKIFERHIAILAKHGVRPTLAGYGDAMLDWLWLAALKQRDKVGQARSMRARVWAELAAA